MSSRSGIPSVGTIDMPGVAAESIDIDVERNVLTVTGERSWETEEDDQIYLNERVQGVYRRQVHLGEGLDPEGIEADEERCRRHVENGTAAVTASSVSRSWAM